MQGAITHCDRRVCFIRADDGREVMAHASEVQGAHHPLLPHERVEFVRHMGTDGKLYARPIKVVKPAEGPL
jgi:cold shock CspA family protein